MKTEDIKELVETVLDTISKPYPTDITDQICLAIENNPVWYNRYNNLSVRHGRPTVNTSIGRYTSYITGLHNLGNTQKAKSKLIKTYSELGEDDKITSMTKTTMSRKRFIKLQGATCNNWTWSWSFINEKKKVIIFGAWDHYAEDNMSLILRKSWQISERGRKQPAYKQSREHIRLIDEEGYQLKTFPIIFSDAHKNKDGIGPSKIEKIIPKLTTKYLKKDGDDWYALDDVIPYLPEEIATPERYIEGALKKITVNAYERNSSARAKCLDYYGYRCAVCSFNFEKFYGSIGKEYIHVHHIVPLADIKEEYELDPIKGLIPVCPNCHAMLHRRQPALTVEQLKEHLQNK